MVLRKLFTVDSSTNGRGPVLFQWQPEGTYLAIAGSNKRLTIVDRQGGKIHQCEIPGTPLNIEWNANGQILAIMHRDDQVAVSLYFFTTKKLEALDCAPLKDLNFIKWSKTGPQLVVGSAKGGLLIFNSDNYKKQSIIGKHNRKILGGAFNKKNIFALSSEDRTVSLSDEEGTTVDLTNVKGEATQLQFPEDHSSDKKKSDSMLSFVFNGKTIMLRNGKELVELAFNPSYGQIVSYGWYGDGYIIVGFSSGYVSVVSTHAKELGSETSVLKSHTQKLSALTLNHNIAKGASIGDSFVRVFDLDDLHVSETKSARHDFDHEFDALTSLQWTEDGQILSVGSKNGNVYSFLTRIPVLSAGYGDQVLYLSSLRELTVRDVVNESDIAKIQIDIEPSFASICTSTAAVGMNNEVHYFQFNPQEKNQKAVALGKRQYQGIVDDVKVSSSFAALLIDGRSVLHHLEDNQEHGNKSLPPQRAFPENKDHGKILSHAMTDNFYMFATQTGNFFLYSLIDQQIICEYKHICGIKSMEPNALGTRVFWIDASNGAYIFNPATEVPTSVERFSNQTDKVLWDPGDYGTLVGSDPKSFTTYVYAANTRYGPTCQAVMKPEDESQPLTTGRVYGFKPIIFRRGIVVCQMPTGALANVSLASHSQIYFAAPGNLESFHNNMALNRLNEALVCAGNNQDLLKQIAERALHVIDIELAIRVHRELNQPTLVMCLERIRHVQEKNLLLGHISMIFRQFNEAQNFFMRSSNPSLALEMRRDLMQWDQALSLAQTLAPEQIPLLAKEYGQQLEFRGEYNTALEMYQQGHVDVPHCRQEDAQSVAAHRFALNHNEHCQCGAARCMLRMGNIRNGMQLIGQLTNQQLFMDCAQILEGMRQFEEAARLYEKAEQYEQAATIFIRDAKMLKAAAPLLPKITSRNVLVMFARAKEAEGSHQEADQAYQKAEDWDNAVRVKVEFLNDLNGAAAIVRKTRSAEAAHQVSKVCRKRGDAGAAVEFLLLAKKTQEAFDVATAMNVMSAFEGALLSQVQLKDGVAPEARRQDFQMIGEYYDNKNSNELAGDFFHVAGNFGAALEKYLAVGTDEYVDKAIAVAGKAKNERLTIRLLDFLEGKVDGKVRDANFIFRLYMALKAYENAARTAVQIASKETQLGNYRAAHKILVDTCLVLQERAIRVSSELRRRLMLVHSYLIVKHLIKPMDDHTSATRMLLRVARNIKKFPMHEAVILTTTVVECLKTDFKHSAHAFSCTLMQNEALRKDIPDKQKRKVEGCIRKRGKEELHDPSEPMTPCPFCQSPVEETALDCVTCKNTLPFCIVTGRHMVLEDWTQCPHCKFPALHSQFIKLLRDDSHCPMCEANVDPMKVAKISDVDPKAFV